jgi:hypothetical protein
MGVEQGLRQNGYEKTEYSERKILQICGPLVQQGIWRKRTNKEFRELYKDTK